MIEQQKDSTQLLTPIPDSAAQITTDTFVDTTDIPAVLAVESLTTKQPESIQIQPVKPVELAPKKEVVQKVDSLIAPSETYIDINDTVIIETPKSAAEVPLPTLRNQQSYPWEVPLLLGCVLLFALMKAFNRRRFNLMIKSVFNRLAVPQNIREENSFSNQVMAGLTLTFILTISMLIFQSIKIWFPTTIEHPFQLYMQICLFIVLVYIIKFAVLELLAEIFNQQIVVREYVYNVLVFNTLLGICLLVIVFANSVSLTYNQFYITLGFILTALLYSYRMWRAVKIGLHHKYPIYYIFLYLCTLEILPLLIVVKLLKAQLT